MEFREIMNMVTRLKSSLELFTKFLSARGEKLRDWSN